MIPAASLPGPRAPALLQTAAWRFRSPLGLYRSYGARYGEAFKLRVLEPVGNQNGIGSAREATLVVVSAPHQLRDAYAISREELLVGAAYQFLEWFLGADSLLTNDGAAHLDERRLLQAALGPEAIPAFERLTRESTVRALGGWPDSGTIDLARRIEDVAKDATLALMFGRRDAAGMIELRSLMQQATASSITLTAMLFPSLQADLGRWSPGGRMARAQARLAAWLDQELARRRAADAHGSDLLGRLLAAYEVFERPVETGHVLNQLKLLLGSAALTTSTIAWTCYHIFRDPSLARRAREAADDESSDSGRAFLDAICKESLRLNPPFVGAVRRAVTRSRVSDVVVEPGMYVVPCFYLTHLRPDIYPEPMAFRPERFLGSTFSPFEYAPFGGGVRKCLGYALAPRQVHIILVELLRAFDIRPATAWSSTDCIRNVLLMPRDPLRAHVRRIRA